MPLLDRGIAPGRGSRASMLVGSPARLLRISALTAWRPGLGIGMSARKLAQTVSGSGLGVEMAAAAGGLGGDTVPEYVAAQLGARRPFLCFIEDV